MPGYRSLDSRFVGVVADATRRADELYRDGDLPGAMSTLEGALALSLTIPPPFPCWAVMRLAFVYRRLKRFPDEAELLERSLPHQADEVAQRRILLRLEKVRSMMARVTPRQPSVLIPACAAGPGGYGTLGENRQRSDRDRRPESHVRRDTASGADAAALHIATHHVGVAFLRAELEIANTMLELAAASVDEASRTRRLERASEAAAEVMSYLTAEGLPIHWTDTEHEELSRGLWKLIRRIRAGAATRCSLEDMFTALSSPWPLAPPTKPRRWPERGGSADNQRY